MIFLEKIKYKSGVTLLETVMAISIISLVLISTVSTLQFFLKRGLAHTEQIQSSFLLEEGMEVVRFFRDNTWSDIGDLLVDTTYYPAFDAGSWEITTTPTTTNSFTRVVTFSDVYRKDSDDQIVASTSPDAKTLDPDTIFVSVKVISPSLIEAKLEAYMTNFLNN